MMSEQLDPKLMLKQAVVKEHMVGIGISTLKPDFYQVIREWLKSLSGEDRNSMESLFNSLFIARKHKVAKLAEAVNTDPDIREKMTTEDRAYFDAIAAATIEFKKSVEIESE